MTASESKFPDYLKSQDKHIHITFATDDRYAPHTGAAIASLLSNTLSERKINIHVLYAKMSNENMHKLTCTQTLRANTCIHFWQINIDEFQSFPTHRAVKAFETYFRLKLPTVLDKVEKVIYLDSDVIVLGDIEKLWCQKLEENFILAVEEPSQLNKESLESLESLGMKEFSPYFNAGVLIMNLSKMRSSGFNQKIAAFVEKRHDVLKGQPQDILNSFFEEQWRPLAAGYNVFWWYLCGTKINKFVYYTDEDLKQAQTTPLLFISQVESHGMPALLTQDANYIGNTWT